MQQPKCLQRLVERPRRIRRNPFQQLGNIPPAEITRRQSISAGQGQHTVDRLDGRIEKLHRLAIPGPDHPVPDHQSQPPPPQ
ncbi:MAG: hypothetical protein KA354_12095 [Phycisphaerae bacterium]|nr:hypothetical protein [Phycisphaerae bacterium]